MKSTIVFIIFVLSFFVQCALFQRSQKIAPVNFDYISIANNYFTPQNEKPFPLTVQRGNNMYNSVTADGKYLFYTTDSKGNYDIWFRDLRSSIVVPITEHPAPEYKPAISNDGKRLAFVTEQFDSKGDIVILDVDMGKWISEMLKGNRFINQDFQLITNTNVDKKESLMDTDPTWSPDGKFLAFSSERLTIGTPNIVVYEISTKKMSLLTEDGASSPNWSLNGEKIVYISYKDSKFGEVYAIDMKTKTKTRLTNDNYLDFSPSLSLHGDILYYTSIRYDTNKNGVLDERDNSYIVRYEIQNKRETYLSPGNTSVFDTKYSTFNCGSILFSAALYNTINVYFVPQNMESKDFISKLDKRCINASDSTGTVAKQSNIQRQFSHALKYRKTHTHEGFLQALNSVRLYFDKDPSYDVFEAKIDIVRAEESFKREQRKDSDSIIQKMLSKKNIPEKSFSYVLGTIYRNNQLGRNSENEIYEYYESLSKSKTPPQVLAAILEQLAILKENSNPQVALGHFDKIIKDFPMYHNMHEIKRKRGKILFQSQSTKLPNEYIELVNINDLSRETLRLIQEDIVSKVLADKNLNEILVHTDRVITENKIKEKASFLLNTLEYAKALALHESREYEKSNDVIVQYMKSYPEVPKEEMGKPELTFFPATDPIFLKGLLLQSYNYERANEKDPEVLLNPIRIFLNRYNPELGVEVDEKEVEKTYRHFENKALEYKNIGSPEALFQMSIRYFFNTENIFKLKYQNLFLNTLYKKYADYYYLKMVDGMLYNAIKTIANKKNTFFDEINFLGEEKLNVIGTTTGFLAKLADNKFLQYFKFLGDFRDLQKVEIYDKGVISIVEDVHFKTALPRARSHLYLASIYGYAHYLINYTIDHETLYRKKNILTNSRKRWVLENLKRAEYELRWIIYADPLYSEAYQLLGWLYQYIDTIKASKITPDDLADGEMFADEYAKYFPEKHFEQNIELYQQILAFLGEHPNKKVLSDLNLNLGNNYLLLNNYPKAKEHFSIVDNLESQVLKSSRFGNYKQEAIFYFNYAKTLLYLGNYDKAIELFKNIIDIYYKNEYYPSLVKNKSEQIDEEEEALKKLTITYALKGLAEMESAKYMDAIRSLRKVLSLNGSSRYINNSNVYNSLAICYQKIENYKRSSSFTAMVREDYKKNRIKNFVNQDVSLWNLVLPENSRIIGDGRFPGEFPAEFSYLLSLGIDVKNYEETNEYESLFQIIDERNKFIKEKNLYKYTIGKIISDKTNQNMGFYKYQVGENSSAIDYFNKEIKSSQKVSVRRDIFKRKNYAIFKYIQEPNVDFQISINLLKNNIQTLQNEKKSAMAICIKNLKLFGRENIQSELEKCEQNFLHEWKHFDPLLALNYYYLGNLLYKKENKESGYYYYGLANQILENPSNVSIEIIGLSSDIYNVNERVRLLINHSLIYLKLGEMDKFKKRLLEAKQLAREYGELDELFIAELIEINHELATNPKSLPSLVKKMDEIEKQISDDFSILTSPEIDLMKWFYDTAMEIDVRLNNLKNLYKNEEKLYYITLYKNMINNRIRLLDPQISKEHADLLDLYKYYNYLYAQKKALIRSHSLVQVQNTEKKLADVSSQIRNLISTISKKSPSKEIFIKPMVSYDMSKLMDKDSIGLRFQIWKNQMIVWKILSEKTEVQKIELKSNDISKEVAQVIEQYKNEIKKYKTLIIIPDKHTASIEFGNIPLENQLLSNLIRINYAYRSSHLFKQDNPTNLNFNSIVSIKPKERFEKIKKFFQNIASFRFIQGKSIGNQIYTADVLETELLPTNKLDLFGEVNENYLNLKEIVEKQNTVSMIILNRVKWTENNFYQNSAAIDIIKSSNIPLIVNISENEKSFENRDFLIGNLENLKQVSQNSNIHFTGLQNSQIFDSSKGSNIGYQQLIESGKNLERTQNYNLALSNLYKASKIKSESGSSDLELDLLIARTKSKYYKNDPFGNYSPLLDKYFSSPDSRIKIYMSFFNYCYLELTEGVCEDYYPAFVQELAFPSLNIVQKTKANSLINFLRKMNDHKFLDFQKLYVQYIEYFKDEEPYLFNYNLSNYLFKNFILDKAAHHANEAIRYSADSKEKEIAQKKLAEIQLVDHFVNNANFPKESLSHIDEMYKMGINKDWIKLLNKTKNYKIDTLNSLDVFRIKLFEIWALIETGQDYNPLFLAPDKTSTGTSMYGILNQIDIALLFKLLKYSIQHQAKNEVNKIFDLLVAEQLKQKNKSMITSLMLGWTEELFFKDYLNEANKYINRYQRRHQNFIREENQNQRFSYLKYKLSLLKEDIETDNFKLNIAPEEDLYLNAKKPFMYKHYKMLEKTKSSDEVYSIINQVLVDLKDKPLSEVYIKEFSDFITYSQSIAQKLKDSYLFFDLSFYKDQISSFDRKYYEYVNGFDNLPKIAKTTIAIQNKIPENQSFISITSYLDKIFILNVSKNKVNVIKVKNFKTTQEYKNDIYNFHRLLKEKNTAVLQKDFIERKFREVLNLDKNIFTYLHLNSFFLKVPLEQRERDNFIVVLNPNLMIDRNIFDATSFYESSLGVQISNTNNSSNIWTKPIKNLEKIELNQSNSSQKYPMYIVNEELYLNEGKQIYFGKTPITKLADKSSKKGFWILYNSKLHDYSFLNYDINQSITFLDKIYEGPGIINTGYQDNLHNLYFTSRFIADKSQKVKLKDRFVSALQELKTRYPSENYWIGYKMYTNVFIK